MWWIGNQKNTSHSNTIYVHYTLADGWHTRNTRDALAISSSFFCAPAMTLLICNHFDWIQTFTHELHENEKKKNKNNISKTKWCACYWHWISTVQFNLRNENEMKFGILAWRMRENIVCARERESVINRRRAAIERWSRDILATAFCLFMLKQNVKYSHTEW